jgi:hypothetical protein
MPLTYDDIDGSWGIYSESWPKLMFTTEEATDRAYIACTKAKIVPYGSFVRMERELRVETEEQKTALGKYLRESPYKTYAALNLYKFSTAFLRKSRVNTLIYKFLKAIQVGMLAQSILIQKVSTNQDHETQITTTQNKMQN